MINIADPCVKVPHNWCRAHQGIWADYNEDYDGLAECLRIRNPASLDRHERVYRFHDPSKFTYCPFCGVVMAIIWFEHVCGKSDID